MILGWKVSFELINSVHKPQSRARPAPGARVHLRDTTGNGSSSNGALDRRVARRGFTERTDMTIHCGRVVEISEIGCEKTGNNDVRIIQARGDTDYAQPFAELGRNTGSERHDGDLMSWQGVTMLAGRTSSAGCSVGVRCPHSCYCLALRELFRRSLLLNG
jgi:hypothetical protein